MYSDSQLSLVWDVQKSVDIYICLKSSGDDIIQLWPMTYQVLTYLKGQTKRHRCYFLTDLHKIDLLFMAHRSRSTVNMWVHSPVTAKTQTCHEGPNSGQSKHLSDLIKQYESFFTLKRFGEFQSLNPENNMWFIGHIQQWYQWSTNFTYPNKLGCQSRKKCL